MVGDVPHRRRRDKLVPIPPKWLGQVTSRRTINARPSKKTGKARRRAKHQKPESKRRWQEDDR